MDDKEPLDTAVAEQQARTLRALEAFRAELTAYKKLAGRAPLFLYEKEAPRLDSEMLRDARLFPDRFQLLRELVRGGVGAEIGVQFGLLSRFILDEINPERLYLYELIPKNIAAEVLDDPRTVLQAGSSALQLSKAPDRSFDWIYIDADHSYEGAQKDCEVACRKIRKGGLIIFNDYTPWSVGEAMSYGVMAVANTLVNRGCPVVGVALAPHGYLDIAVRYDLKD